MMISVQVLLISSLMLSAFFGTSNCVIVVNEGDIGLYFAVRQLEHNCVKRIGNNLDHLAVGTLIEVMRTDHPSYGQFEGRHLGDGKYDPDVCQEIRGIITRIIPDLLKPIFINII
ncbi:uncharacterized protein LOC126845330, partial [Adelges cooleyi]